MTDNEIIKALECCSRGDDGCDECPLTFNDCVSPILTMERLMRDALSLINRQKAEIERLEARCENTQIGYNFAKADVEMLQADYRRACAERDAHICTTQFAKAEAIKEFTERLEPLKKFRSCMATSEYELSVTMREIDNLVKEMVGDAE